MKKKIYVAVFFIILCLPSLAMLFYKTDANVEKRKVQSFPDLKKEGKLNVRFFDELSNYFSDNFAYRQELIAIDALIKSKICSGILKLQHLGRQYIILTNRRKSR